MHKQLGGEIMGIAKESLKEKNSQLSILYAIKILFRDECRIKSFSDKRK